MNGGVCVCVCACVVYLPVCRLKPLDLFKQPWLSVLVTCYICVLSWIRYTVVPSTYVTVMKTYLTDTTP